MSRGKSGRGVEPLATSIRIKFYIGGQPFRETLKLPPTPPNIRYAERLKQEIDAKIGLGLFDYTTYFPDSANLAKLGLSKGNKTFKEYADLWYETTGNLSKGTRIQYKRYLDAVWCKQYGTRVIAEIKPSELEAFVASRAWVSVKNRNNHLTALRGPFRLAIGDEVIRKDPTSNIQNLTYDPPGPDPFTLTEIDKILADMHKHYKEQIANFFEVALFTGMRPEEQIALRWPDMDWNMEMVRIDKAVSYGEEKGTKTGRKRDVELLFRALDAFRRQKKFTFLQGDFIFLSPRTGKPFPSSQQLRDTYWKASLKRCGIRGRDMYQTRHTYACMNLMAGAKPAWIAKQLGHSVVMLLSTYAKWADGDDQGREKAKLEARLKQGG